MMAIGIFGQQQNPQMGGVFGRPAPGPNYQSGPQGWMRGYGNALPMGSGDHMPLVSTSQSHRPPQQAMAPGQGGQPQQRFQPAPHQGGGPNANEPWNDPSWVQPTPTYNAPAWGTNAIGWGGTGNAPQMPHGDPISQLGGIPQMSHGDPIGPQMSIGDPLPPPPVMAAGAGGPGSVGAGMPPGQWQAVIQALSGLGSNMFAPPQMSGGDPGFLNMLLSGLGGR
jgi:hypothetical protein